MIIDPPYRIQSLNLTDETIEQYKRVRQLLDRQVQIDMLDLLIVHTRAEWIDFDIDAAMATFTPSPQIWRFGAGPRPGLIGYDAVRDNYLRQSKCGANGGGMEFDRLVIDGEAIVAEGTIVQTGEVAATAWPEINAVLDRDRTSLVRKRAVLIVPFEEGLIAGEYIYLEGPYTADDVVYV